MRICVCVCVWACVCACVPGQKRMLEALEQMAVSPRHRGWELQSSAIVTRGSALYSVSLCDSDLLWATHSPIIDGPSLIGSQGRSQEYIMFKSLK